MIMYSLTEILWITAFAIVLDWIIGDPRHLPHPVIYMGKCISFLEKKLLSPSTSRGFNQVKLSGVFLLLITSGITTICTAVLILLANSIHPWIGYALSVWLIATSIAVKGLKDAAKKVWQLLASGDLIAARASVGMIVGRDTDKLNQREVSRAAIETVAENIVDAFVSPLCFAIVGGAPGAMLYRAVNTLDAMVGYTSEKYRYFGWASARFDDLLNYIPARLTGIFLVLIAYVFPSLSGTRAAKSIFQFAHLHPSPNSGIPESAAAGAIGIQLGGTNAYGGVVSKRAFMGWALRPLEPDDILLINQMLSAVRIVCLGGLLCALWLIS